MRLHQCIEDTYFCVWSDRLLDLDSELCAANVPLLMLLGVEDFLNGWDGEE